MQARESVRFMECCDRERNEELIGVLFAISVVSKRLAGKLIALEHLEAEKTRGGKLYGIRQNAATRR
ncbi:hypothetical protein SDC9_136397 [bioreactor metagenome]|uniref:Uncharacterized protein n=1 Tax=bioreactor metagenome TaxID=1076179 RepID=A0A645DJ14_9ZZZZ